MSVPAVSSLEVATYSGILCLKVDANGDNKGPEPDCVSQEKVSATD